MIFTFALKFKFFIFKNKSLVVCSVFVGFGRKILGIFLHRKLYVTVNSPLNSNSVLQRICSYIPSHCPSLSDEKTVELLLSYNLLSVGIFLCCLLWFGNTAWITCRDLEGGQCCLVARRHRSLSRECCRLVITIISRKLNKQTHPAVYLQSASYIFPVILMLSCKVRQ